jgi:endonuclease YncB( thermonuclease family)
MRGWVAAHKWLTALVVVAVLGWTTSAGADEDESGQRRSAEPSAEPRASATPETEPSTEPGADAEPTSSGSADPQKRDRDRSDRRDEATRSPTPKPAPAPAPRTYLVTRVIDGDTLELASGQDVRLVGIDTPEVGECGYDKAAANLAYLTLDKQVTLTVSDEDQDRYGRLLRYVNIGDVDAGLRLIKNGLAIARYDSRDGYGFHQREPVYIAADRAHGNITCAQPAQPAPAAAPAPQGGACAPGYSPCVPPYPPDVDCADVNGPISVTGTDPHGLDADGDGVACE